MTFEEYIIKLNVCRYSQEAHADRWFLSKANVEEYAKMKAEQSARRAAEYVLDNAGHIQCDGDIVNRAIQHAISEGDKCEIVKLNLCKYFDYFIKMCRSIFEKK